MTPQILLFDLYAGGHHGFYLDVLHAFWLAHQLPGHLHIAVSPEFVSRHPEAVALQDSSRATLHIMENVPGDAPLLARDRQHGRILRQTIEATKATHVAALYWDHAQLATAKGLRFGWPVRFSGIYFRPSFHYGTIGGPNPSWRDRVLAVRKRLVLRAALLNPHLHTLFSLDPFAVPHINEMAQRQVAVFLPDPVRVPDATTMPTVLDKADPERKKLLIFGVLDHRKGVLPVCQALAALAPEAQARLTLALAGPVEGGDAAEVRAALDDLRRQSAVQVLLDDRFVPDAEIQRLIGQADLVLLTYHQHIGSSNVLVRAAAANVPVLATNYGMVGAQVRQRGLGLTTDATDPAAIARGIATWHDDPLHVPFDAASARTFFLENTAEAYATTFWNRLLSSK